MSSRCSFCSSRKKRVKMALCCDLVILNSWDITIKKCAKRHFESDPEEASSFFILLSSFSRATLTLDWVLKWEKMLHILSYLWKRANFQTYWHMLEKIASNWSNKYQFPEFPFIIYHLTNIIKYLVLKTIRQNSLIRPF